MGRYENGFDEWNHGTIAAIMNQTPSTSGHHGVPFGKEGPSAGGPRAQGPPRGSNQGTGKGWGTGRAGPSELPRAGAPRQERAAFLSTHKCCFAFAFQGACPRHDCSFNHDDSLIPAGYFKAHASKKRFTNESQEGREVSHPKRSLYALSDEQVDLVAAYFDEDMESAGGEGVDELDA